MRRFTTPPRAIRKAKLDNLVLVPASLLPLKGQFQAIANQQAPGTTLVVLPAGDSLPRRTLERVASRMQQKGQPVKMLVGNPRAVGGVY
jgi:hypothetical protein